jgi:SulP family sulfate permease
MVPEGMAYAGIVGVPPIMGLYTIVPALLAYALFGTSRQLVVGPDTATGLLSALTVGAVAAHGTAEFNWPGSRALRSSIRASSGSSSGPR